MSMTSRDVHEIITRNTCISTGEIAIEPEIFPLFPSSLKDTLNRCIDQLKDIKGLKEELQNEIKSDQENQKQILKAAKLPPDETKRQMELIDSEFSIFIASKIVNKLNQNLNREKTRIVTLTDNKSDSKEVNDCFKIIETYEKVIKIIENRIRETILNRITPCERELNEANEFKRKFDRLAVTLTPFAWASRTPFHMGVLVQCLAVREAINAADKADEVTYNSRTKRFEHSSLLQAVKQENNFLLAITLDDMNTIRTDLANYLQAQTREDLERARNLFNAFKADPIGPIQIGDTKFSREVCEAFQINNIHCAPFITKSFSLLNANKRAIGNHPDIAIAEVRDEAFIAAKIKPFADEKKAKDEKAAAEAATRKPPVAQNGVPAKNPKADNDLDAFAVFGMGDDWTPASNNVPPPERKTDRSAEPKPEPKPQNSNVQQDDKALADLLATFEAEDRAARAGIYPQNVVPQPSARSSDNNGVNDLNGLYFNYTQNNNKPGNQVKKPKFSKADRAMLAALAKDSPIDRGDSKSNRNN